jgi:hypothetical protein
MSPATHEENPMKALTADQMHAVHEWLRTKVQHRNCPSCDHPEVDVQAEFLGMLTYDDEGRLDAGMAAPFVVVTCQNCAQSRFFSAAKLGLVHVSR